MFNKLHKILLYPNKLRHLNIKSIYSNVSITTPWVFERNKSFPVTPTGGRHTVTMIPGSGIGPELMEIVREISEFCGAPINFEVTDVDPENEDYSDIEYAITTMHRNKCCIKGQIAVSKRLDIKSKDMIFQQALDLYVRVVQCQSFRGLKTKHQNVDLIIITQNTEGEYKMLEHEVVPGVVECMKIITKRTSERVAKYGFQFAKQHARKKVTVVHKQAAMKLSDGLFVDTAREVSKLFPEIQFEIMSIDVAARKVVTHPNRFDVILTINLYGNVLMHTISGLIGGHGTVYGVSLGDNQIVFEQATRSIAKDLLGSNKLNPIPAIRAFATMLIALGHTSHGVLLRSAIYRTVLQDNIRTPDLGGVYTTKELVENIKSRIFAGKRIF